MEFNALKQITYSSHFPLNFNVAGMQPNILLMCKLLFLLMLAHGYLGYINDPYIPFLKILDAFSNYPNLFKITIKSLFLGSGIFLLFNIKPRLMSIVLGSSIILVILSSKSLFRNHLFICGCVFILAGLSDKEKLPWLLYLQLSLIYFGAVINKVFELDWWNGQFIHNWLTNSRENEPYIIISGLLPEMWFAKILSWISMVLELSIAILILIRNKHHLAGWMILLFHSILYTMTFFRFGHFFEDIVIVLLIFLIWPKTKLIVSIGSDVNSFFKLIINFFFLNKTISYNGNLPHSDTFWLKVNCDKKSLIDKKALIYLLKFTPNFYVLLFAFDQLIRFLFNGDFMHSIQITVMWICILFFIPRKFNTKMVVKS